MNRVSLGVQSLDPAVLELLGRGCPPDTARAALALAGRSFARVSADWILGPEVTPARLLAELDEALDLGVEHVSLYILELHAGTPLARAVADGTVVLPPDHETEALYLACGEHLSRRGLRQYEVSNFARPGAESRHNQAYWSGRPFLGLGPSASGFWGRRRYTNARTVDDYLARVEAGALPEDEVDPLTPAARRLEALLLPLRTASGVPCDRLPAGALDLEAGTREGLWTVAAGRLALTPRGFLRIDTIEGARWRGPSVDTRESGALTCAAATPVRAGDDGQEPGTRDEILDAVVRLNIETGRPVSSGLVARARRGLYSAATVRNVMKSLEEAGYLEQPHTSAGRRPTDAGFRRHVDGVLSAGRWRAGRCRGRWPRGRAGLGRVGGPRHGQVPGRCC